MIRQVLETQDEPKYSCTISVNSGVWVAQLLVDAWSAAHACSRRKPHTTTLLC